MLEPFHHQLTNCLHGYNVADPGCLSRIFSIADPGSASKNLSILTQKIVCNLSEIWSGLFIPDSDPDFLPIPDPGQKGTGSRIQESKRAPDPGFGSATLMVTGIDLSATNATQRLLHLLISSFISLSLACRRLISVWRPSARLETSSNSNLLAHKKLLFRVPYGLNNENVFSKAFFDWLGHVLCPSSSRSPLSWGEGEKW